MDTKEKLIELKERTGYNWREFAAYFGIPYRKSTDRKVEEEYGK